MFNGFRFRAPAILRHQPIEPIFADQPMVDGLRPIPANWQCDLPDDRLRWHPGVFALFGMSQDMRLDRRDVVGMYCDDSRAELERLRSDAIRHARAFTFDARIRRTDGAWRWMRVAADVVVRGGRVTQLYGSKLDITDDVATGLIRPAA